MSLRWCESPGTAARIAALSADQAPTAIIGCPHMESASPALRPISPAARARQDRQRRQCRHRTQDGGLHLVDRLHDSISAKDGVT